MQTRPKTFLFFSLAFLAGCQCITPPSTDPNPPAPTLTVIFNNAQGLEETRFVNRTDHTADISVQVEAQRPFTIFYSANDAGGVKTLTLDWKYNKILSSGLGQLVSPLIAPDDFSSCAKTYRAVNRVHQWEGEARQWQFILIADDFKGNHANTPKITVGHGP